MICVVYIVLQSLLVSVRCGSLVSLFDVGSNPASLWEVSVGVDPRYLILCALAPSSATQRHEGAMGDSSRR